jgi:hypothetical protein
MGFPIVFVGLPSHFEVFNSFVSYTRASPFQHIKGRHSLRTFVCCHSFFYTRIPLYQSTFPSFILKRWVSQARQPRFSSLLALFPRQQHQRDHGQLQLPALLHQPRAPTHGRPGQLRPTLQAQLRTWQLLHLAHGVHQALLQPSRTLRSNFRLCRPALRLFRLVIRAGAILATPTVHGNGCRPPFPALSTTSMRMPLLRLAALASLPRQKSVFLSRNTQQL